MWKQLLTIGLPLVLGSGTVIAGNLSFSGVSDKSSVVYSPGEKMVFKVQLLEDSKPVKGKKLKWVRTGDDQKTEKGEAVSSATQPLLIETALATPGFVRIAVTLYNSDGKPAKDEKGQEIRFDGGAGVELEKLAGVPEPKDFDAFWAKQKAELAKIPLKVSLVEVPSANPNIQVFDVKVDCAGGTPVSGYLCKPKGAAAKSLSCQVNFMGYSVNSAKPDMQEKTLTFSMNAHGIENGREPEYYKQLQALTAAGLDRDVTKCLAFIPWCCDLGGIRLGRIRGWRPDNTDTLGYYDPINHAKRITCETSLSAGLGDYTCPPSGHARQLKEKIERRTFNIER